MQTTFSQDVLKEKNADSLVIDDRAQLAGMPPNEIAAAEAAAKADKQGRQIRHPPRSTPPTSPRSPRWQDRALRERLLQTSLDRNSHGGEFDTRATVSRIAKLRAEHAVLLGYPNHAAYQLDDQTAGSVATVNKLLAEPRAARRRQRQAARPPTCRKIIDQEGGKFPARRLGLGFLLGEGPQGALRFRRIAAASLFRVEPRAARRRVLRGGPAVRADVQGAARPAGVPAGRARLRGVRRRRLSRWRSSWRITTRAPPSAAARG